jgi:hypothetical protein
MIGNPYLSLYERSVKNPQVPRERRSGNCECVAMIAAQNERAVQASATYPEVTV